MNFAKKKCIPCEDKNLKPLTKKQVVPLIVEIPGWTMDTKVKKISRTWLFKDFITAMNFIKKIATIAEREGHHPDIFVSYNKVIIDLWTHSINGLSENDFIVAAKINQIKL
jgi:4a-hydroxytetrahydrobiopterin dehydratase